MYLKKESDYIIIPDGLKQTFENKFSLNIGKNELIKMKANGTITDRDINILKILFEFKFATAEQIGNLVMEEGKPVNIKYRLDKLVRYRVLNKFMLGAFEIDKIGDDAFQIYCLDLGGRYLLSHYSGSDASDWYSIVNMKSSAIISKNILSTEFYSKLMATCPGKVDYFKVDPEYRIGKKNLFPSFELCMKVGASKKYFVGEIFRSFDSSIEIRERISKLESFFLTNTWKKYFYDAAGGPVLFVFVDDDVMALEVSKMIMETSEIRNFRVSTDVRIVQKELNEKGAFLKYLPEEQLLAEVIATTFSP